MILVRWIINALVIMAVAYILAGVSSDNFWTALVAALVLAILNVILKPILLLLTLPITIVTLGLFALVVNGLVILFMAWLVPGIKVEGIWWAIAFGILVSIGNYVTAVKKW